MNNGYFKSLKDIVHFYNVLDKRDAQWPAPEDWFLRLCREPGAAPVAVKTYGY